MMSAAWALNRAWSAFLRANSLMFVLRLLRDDGMSERDALLQLQSRYGSAPSAREFRRLTDMAVRGGYVSLDGELASRTLRITPPGVELLRRLEKEYRVIAASMAPRKGVLLTR